MIKINTILNNKEWYHYIKNPRIYVEKKIKKINNNFKKYKNNKIFCTLLLSGNNKIKKDKEVYIGDIIINLNKIKSRKKRSDFKVQFNKLWIHGLLHLFGYKHSKDKDHNKMLKIEKDFLSYLKK